ncbi:uncharacterized protein Pyn_02977 [Prunus yedoensis var. nudiflora]|uniref:Uncharacterized protein n=1 Tax=Prunus yedoensis var. nudiflora TaxID=2094558 RepID=A0A314UZB9_PRUYE|nr:uncharacterized protein Pyn_02977 [Prunus yedoensis var. nudiflora]
MASTSLLSSSSIVSFNPFSGMDRHRKRAARSATRVFASSRKEADHELTGKTSIGADWWMRT